MEMKRFVFRLEAVLKLRQQRQDAALAALGAAQRAHQEASEFKRSLQKQLDDGLLKRERLADAVASTLSYRMEQDFIDGNKARIIRADHAVIRAQRGVEKALRTYLLARRQTRMIEVLREKDEAEHRAIYRKRELKQLDEMNIMRARLAANEFGPEEVA
jgi:flagellar FliJ protein